MPAPYTVVTLVDEDGDEFPVRLPGVYPNEDLDVLVDAAIHSLAEIRELRPRGELALGPIEYCGVQ